MERITLLCTDGSDVAIEALRASIPLLAPADRTIVVTVESPVSSDSTTGNGFHVTSRADFGGVVETTGDAAARDDLLRTVDALELDDVEFMAIVGDTGPAICRLADEFSASVVVIGTSGRGGLRRAVMGSTSDHIVRHAPCPVLVQGVGQG
ncbi:MAG: universal stress protein [Actinomycetota bacterium]